MLTWFQSAISKYRVRRHSKQVRFQPFINDRLFKTDRAFLSSRNALLASAYKHPGVYKRSVLFTCIAKGPAPWNNELQYVAAYEFAIWRSSLVNYMILYILFVFVW